MTRVVGIVGAGRMGTGIAQVVVEAGDRVRIHDASPAAVDAALERVRDGLARRADGRHPTTGPDWIAERMDRIATAATPAALAREADLVIEAVVEDLDVKRELFHALDAAAAPDAILATNTSALRVHDIAAATASPERVIGLHWFNPPTRMALVEVIAAERTSAEVVGRAIAAVTAWGRTPVRSADTPGFIVNRVNRPFTIEALRLLEARIADVPTIDAALRGAGFPMGPFELMDLTGIDISLAAARGVWEGLGRPEHLRPSPIQEGLVAAGRLGRSTGEGFYRYVEGRRGEPAEGFAFTLPTVPDPASIAACIVGAIDAEAARAAAAGVASRDDIELALRLGAGHPVRSTP
ncbi:MAG: 3-hydroxyacyl-CoA dehydrogenase family protein [Candidatus Limnocylindria bacterium]